MYEESTSAVCSTHFSLRQLYMPSSVPTYVLEARPTLRFFVGIPQEQPRTVVIPSRSYLLHKALIPFAELLIARIIYFPYEAVPRKVIVAHISRGGSYSIVHNEEDLCSRQLYEAFSCPSLRETMSRMTSFPRCRSVSFTCVCICSMMQTPLILEVLILT